jgi:hypothetical protein
MPRAGAQRKLPFESTTKALIQVFLTQTYKKGSLELLKLVFEVSPLCHTTYDIRGGARRRK